MYFIEKQLEELRRFESPLTRAEDFDFFWEAASGKVMHHDFHAENRPAEHCPFPDFRIYDTRIYGLDGTPVHAWTLLPAFASRERRVPAVVLFHGGNGSRGKNPYTRLHFAAAGFAVIVSDFRLQGGATRSNTPIKYCAGKSFATGNLDQDKENYYFHHAFTDQMLMVRYAMSLEEVDASRVAVAGASQGGGTSLILAGLMKKEIALCIASVPSYTCWERRIFTRTACAAEIAKYLELHPERTEQIFRLMSYFDAMNFRDRIVCPVEVQCSLKDALVPPECVYAGYNRIRAPKNIRNYPFGEHHDVDGQQWLLDLCAYLHPEKIRGKKLEMRIERISLRRVCNPVKHPYATAFGGGAEITTESGYLPFCSSPGLEKNHETKMKRLDPDSGFYNYGHRASSTDMGDVGMIMPALHACNGGTADGPHTAEFSVPDPAYLRPPTAGNERCGTAPRRRGCRVRPGGKGPNLRENNIGNFLRKTIK